MNVFNEARKAATKLDHIAKRRDTKVARATQEYVAAVALVVSTLDERVVTQLNTAGLLPTDAAFPGADEPDAPSQDGPEHDEATLAPR